MRVERNIALEKLCPDEGIQKLIFQIVSIPQYVDLDDNEFRRRIFCDINYVAEISEATWIFTNALNFRDTPSIAKALSKYTFSADYLRWLMEQMLRKERTDVVLLIEKKLEEIGALDEANRFEL